MIFGFYFRCLSQPNQSIMKNTIKIGDSVKHRKTKMWYTVDGSVSGATYNDGEREWVNVKAGSKPIHLLSFPLSELTR